MNWRPTLANLFLAYKAETVIDNVSYVLTVAPTFTAPSFGKWFVTVAAKDALKSVLINDGPFINSDTAKQHAEAIDKVVTP
jgi:hypothetical protein